ncbi:MAG: TPR repeat protein [Cognaticolwellia sp.]|jgi:TPR repeat protein
MGMLISVWLLTKTNAGKPLIRAMHNLTKFYHYGFGTEIDKARALNFYKKAGMRGLREAEYSAGMLLLTDEELYDFDDGVN